MFLYIVHVRVRAHKLAAKVQQFFDIHKHFDIFFRFLFIFSHIMLFFLSLLDFRPLIRDSIPRILPFGHIFVAVLFHFLFP